MADVAIAPNSARAGGTRTGDVVLRTRGLTKRYGERLAVDELNLEVYRGEIFGFLGPTARARRPRSAWRWG